MYAGNYKGYCVHSSDGYGSAYSNRNPSSRPLRNSGTPLLQGIRAAVVMQELCHCQDLLPILVPFSAQSLQVFVAIPILRILRSGWHEMTEKQPLCMLRRRYNQSALTS